MGKIKVEEPTVMIRCEECGSLTNYALDICQSSGSTPHFRKREVEDSSIGEKREGERLKR